VPALCSIPSVTIPLCSFIESPDNTFILRISTKRARMSHAKFLILRMRHHRKFAGVREKERNS